ncbi:SDR family NAD(P)-dependent oxidoreductase [Mycolicibacterium monacense]|uniref:Short-chain dehydrogenase n=1 Tax=Mycolicibacterium monacense TaxID=85693 RepID=A0AAD1IY71_MYCMB|nr:SDR family NAD(P)-dependent oxidoreductase [Mycolicibacterium monacense]MDA4103909.1 short-chain dehydrogenase [Mycolicibacterium monacense DSM 44395]ORB23153.1 short-chain dehydrogenase [Mycolicibacterium monacense DSM 44395]QHP85295.1 SDR family oxidoreductase [Mycolicibacterium monacense DSM 44395]BBZ61847.1 short-chain dehydrogenase [Mycolicibacterium monacense]
MSEKSYAVIVGGASGIGATIVRAMADRGYAVVVADRNIDAANALVEQLGAGGHTAAEVDVVDEAGVATLFESVAALPGRFEVAVNCAGITALGLVTDLPVNKFRRVVDVCLAGAFLVIQHAGRHLADGGTIISLSSLNARQPAVGMSAYSSAKAGLSMLTQVAALELAPRIRVNAVAPGLVRTPLTSGALGVPGVEDEYVENIPLGRPGTPEEIADAVMYLATAEWTTGEVLDLNGGAHLMRYPNVHAHFEQARTR